MPILTQQFIDELLSLNFLEHRIELGIFLEEFNKTQELLVRFAQGFWYPSGDNEYSGEEYAGLNLQLHFEALKEWARRLAHAVRRERVGVEDIKASLYDSQAWMDALLTPVATEVSKQLPNQQKAALPQMHGLDRRC